MTPGSHRVASADSESPRRGHSAVMGGALVVGMVSLVWGFLLQRTGRRRVEVSLDERLRFESLLSELSASLIDVSMSDLDGAIERGLQRVGTFLKVDRANLHEYVDKGGRSFASRGPPREFGRCPASSSLISSHGPPSSFGEGTSSGFPGWTSSPSRLRSTVRAIGEAARNQTCRSPCAPRRVPCERALLRFDSRAEDVAGRAAVAPPASRRDLHGRSGAASSGAGPHRTATLRGPPVGAVRGVQRLARSRRRSRDHSLATPATS
jgi:hypothetical protein